MLIPRLCGEVFLGLSFSLLSFAFLFLFLVNSSSQTRINACHTCKSRPESEGKLVKSESGSLYETITNFSKPGLQKRGPLRNKQSKV